MKMLEMYQKERIYFVIKKSELEDGQIILEKIRLDHVLYKRMNVSKNN